MKYTIIESFRSAKRFALNGKSYTKKVTEAGVEFLESDDFIVPMGAAMNFATAKHVVYFSDLIELAGFKIVNQNETTPH